MLFALWQYQSSIIIVAEIIHLALLAVKENVLTKYTALATKLYLKYNMSSTRPFNSYILWFCEQACVPPSHKLDNFKALIKSPLGFHVSSLKHPNFLNRCSYRNPLIIFTYCSLGVFQLYFVWGAVTWRIYSISVLTQL